MKKTLALLACITLLSGCAGQEKETVVTKVECAPSKTIEYWANFWGVAHWKPLSELQKISFLSWFNNLPPVSDFNPPLVYIANHKDILIIIFHDRQCVTLVNTINTENNKTDNRIKKI